MEIISNIALISINETLVVQLVSFLVFMYVINRIMFKPLTGIIGERNEHIDGMQMEIVKAEEELERVKQMLRENETAVKNNAFSIKTELESDGDKTAAEIFQEAKNEIDAMQQKAQAEVKVQVEEARRSMERESEVLVVQIMEKVLERRLS